MFDTLSAGVQLNKIYYFHIQYNINHTPDILFFSKFHPILAVK